MLELLTVNALEQSFADLCTKHGLRALQVAFHVGHQQSFTSYAHAEPAVCGMGVANTIAGAVGEAIADLNAKQPITLADEPLTEIAA